ncbi:MAG: TonB-dependent vitamin B12 receptor [Gammaproteobacteria bacterium]|nr:TonB-dependent vitamin B12 receptor [Gammaproteobacteria bacterium]
MNRSIFAAVLASVGLSVAVAETVSPVVVTASRVAETADEALASVTVITREELEQRQVNTLAEALTGLAGVNTVSNGGRGTLTSLFIRGTESNHVLVLVDGVRIGRLSAGTAAIEQIPVSQIERIELVRGPRSSLYGSDAIGGVIQIFTRKGDGPAALHFSATGGSNQTGEVTAGVSGSYGSSTYSLTGSRLESDGINACHSATSGCFTLEPDKDGYDSDSFSARFGHHFGEGAELQLTALRSSGEVEFDGSFTNQADLAQQVLGASLRLEVTEWWSLTLRGGNSEDKSDSFLNGVFSSRFDTSRDTLGLQNDWVLADNLLLIVGYDYLEDELTSTTAFTVDSRDNHGWFGQLQGEWGAHSVTLALRGDDNEQFGSHTTGNLAWGLELSQRTRLFAAYGTAFTAPTFNDLYFPFGFGNPGLAPEESETIEVGLSGQSAWGTWQANLYETRIDDLIELDGFFIPQNTSEARIRGLELSGSGDFGPWQVRSAVTLQDPENRASHDPNSGNLLARRPERMATLDLDRTFGEVRVGSTIRAQSHRWDNLANTKRLGGFVLLDLRVERPLGQHWLLQGKIENLLDKTYEPATGYNSDDRAAYLTLRYQP